ncbi:hypothetical protein CMO91_03795 [Candidatus Woesearchaeota archaeon]|jgi:hypothetical protein|nr:hypothetical protein [Candidatus Woesearchaeota archaeon]|tara:strand:- start:634 stop:1407 length:774 start_codon:yes stop_codon:yes gene_type:complete
MLHFFKIAINGGPEVEEEFLLLGTDPKEGEVSLLVKAVDHHLTQAAEEVTCQKKGPEHTIGIKPSNHHYVCQIGYGASLLQGFGDITVQDNRMLVPDGRIIYQSLEGWLADYGARCHHAREQTSPGLTLFLETVQPKGLGEIEREDHPEAWTSFHVSQGPHLCYDFKTTPRGVRTEELRLYGTETDNGVELLVVGAQSFLRVHPGELVNAAFFEMIRGDPGAKEKHAAADEIQAHYARQLLTAEAIPMIVDLAAQHI